METSIDFLERLHPDMALKVLTCLDNSSDLVRVSAVSRHWQNIVVTNGLCKQLCITTFPQLSSITSVVEPSHYNLAEREHRAYASLFKAIKSYPQTNCIDGAVSASSTNDYPRESIKNTRVRRGTYWSSKGSNDPETPETLIYKLTESLCVVTAIHLHPFQGLFESDYLRHSSGVVRFRMGHPKSWKALNYDFIAAQECANDKFIWTYTSPLFPVSLKSRRETFMLPEPVVCVGGYLQIELSGRVKKASDEKYYLCVAFVQAKGCGLSPAFSVYFSEPSNNVCPKYDANEFGDSYSRRNYSLKNIKWGGILKIQYV